ncbi:OTU deubiquitinase [Paramecium bursaria]
MGCCLSEKKFRSGQEVNQQGLFHPEFQEIIRISNIDPNIPIIGENSNIQQLCENFTLNEQDLKIINPKITGYIHIRGLQQSFSTCLAYNLLWLLRCQNRLDSIQLNTFKLKYKNIEVDDIQSQYYLKYRINSITNITNYRQQFNINYELFILAVTFIKNYIYQIYSRLEIKAFLDGNGLDKGLLEWQSDSHEYDQILALLAKELKIQIIVINVSNKQVRKQEYQSFDDTIMLIVNNGNCYIGLFKDSILYKDQIMEVRQIKPNNVYLSNQQVVQLINNLYDLSFRQRVVEEEFSRFVGKQKSLEELYNHYFGQNRGEIIKKLPQELKGFIPIRGDGNCFYTAVSYSYLKMLIEKNKLQILEQNIKDVNFEIQYQKFIINIQQGELIKMDFINQMKQFQNVESLYSKVSDPQNILYGEMIIFIRSYVKHQCLQDKQILETASAIGIDLSTNLISWEEECDMNEVIINKLSESLKVQINIIFIDSIQQAIDIRQYGKNKQFQINLIMSPGHYNIAIR